VVASLRKGSELFEETLVTATRQMGDRQRVRRRQRTPGLLDTHFYCFMSQLIAVIVVYGFSRTIDKNLIHPAVPRHRFFAVHNR
jgi:transposase